MTNRKKGAPKPSGKSGGAGVPGMAARKAASDILGRVTGKGRPLDQEVDPLNGHAGFKALDTRDRALVRAILGTALRRRGQITAILAALLERPIPEKTGVVENLLHVGLAQILFMDVPDHAAVDIAVTMCERDRRCVPYKGLVNAVLRRAAREKADILESFGKPELAAPEWLFNRWRAAYGEETAIAIAAMHLLEPNLDLTTKEDADGWAQRLGGTRIGKTTVRLSDHSGPIDELEGFSDGAWWVQDAAASLPALLLGDIAGKRVGDLCAAPGGKTAQLAAMGADVTAIDISASRLKRLERNLSRLGLKAAIVATDLRYFTPDEPYEAILLDAPCSATGTIRRHPDVAWAKTPMDIEMLAAVQEDLLARAFTWLKPGGTMVFCTCSLEPEEGERRIEAFLNATPDARRIPVEPAEIGGIEGAITPDGDLRTLPSLLPAEPPEHGGLDGFFAARIGKAAG
ncbi:RsmB/NOP family class I SAM-dependent RNA methyltransferase [Hongsoonwoonella zoysiae]|uniref:RsmB/NOP family class I SAM-dependent RNA methyltransferase n=1 Tax=Hongsoonwoonella zoysiae TaxID=2821844 RepID=UPI001FEA18EA|nr:transcription antitermination factor NusB [Hongsoonwoonella zoysiae]